MRRITPHERLAAELEKIIKEAQNVLNEYYAATAKRNRIQTVDFIDPRTKKRVKIKRK